MKKIRSFLKIILSALCIAILVWGFNLVRQCKDGKSESVLFSLGTRENSELLPSPTQLRSIERIGKWEFLSIETEEIVDTVRQRLLLPDQHLVRIYRGTLSLGIDLSQAQQDWVRMREDTVVVALPPIVLLNPQFINEAETQTFHETGTWDAQSREQLYQKARRQMLDRCLSERNKEKAREAGKAQMETLMRNLGIVNVVVE